MTEPETQPILQPSESISSTTSPGLPVGEIADTL
jgi:hypothetical protein